MENSATNCKLLIANAVNNYAWVYVYTTCECVNFELFYKSRDLADPEWYLKPVTSHTISRKNIEQMANAGYYPRQVPDRLPLWQLQQQTRPNDFPLLKHTSVSHQG